MRSLLRLSFDSWFIIHDCLAFGKVEPNKKDARSAERLKETRQQGFAFVFQNAAPCFNAVEKAMIRQIHLGAAAARDLVKRAEFRFSDGEFVIH